MDFLILLSLVELQAKVAGKPGYVGSFAGYDEYVPMVDKAVDAGWKKQASLQMPSASKGSNSASVCSLFSLLCLKCKIVLC